MTNHINFRTATAPRPTAPAPRVPRIDPHEAPNPGNETPRRTPRNWMVPVGLAVVASAAVVGLVVQSTSQQGPGNEIPTHDTPVEVGNIRIDTESERPSDLVVSGWYTTRSYGEPTTQTADTATDAERPGDLVVSGSNVTRTFEPTAEVQRTSDSERPGDLVVSGWYTTRSNEPAIENTAAPALDPVIIGEPVALAGTASCFPIQPLGPNTNLAPDPTGQRSSGVEILDELRQRGPNVDLTFDPHGQRSSGQDPICVAG